MNQLVESVWDGDEPRQPQVAIRSYVSNLRRAIEPNRRRRSSESCLASSPPGYRLAIDPISVDWVRFERLVNEGRRCLGDRDPTSAIGRLRRATELWGGQPCAGLPESPFFVAQVARLSELKQTAIELLFEALLALGDHSSVTAEVEAAIAENPLRERLTELGMLAFYRSGRQSEALALGQRLRARLVEDLGVDPSRSIDTLELKILNHDTSLEPMEAGSTAAVLPSVSENRLLTSGSAPAFDHADSLPGLQAPEPTPSTLVEIGPPIGRGTELAMLGSLQAALDAGRSATAIITGEQGIGKTHLVRCAASQLSSNRVVVAWSRTVPGETTPLWPWAQVILSLIAAHGGNLPFKITADLAPLAALGPSVAGSLGLPLARYRSGRGVEEADVLAAANASTASTGPTAAQTSTANTGATANSASAANSGSKLSAAPPAAPMLPDRDRAGTEAMSKPVDRSAPDSEVVIDLDSLSTQEEGRPGQPTASEVEVSGLVPLGIEYGRGEVMLAVTSLLQRSARLSPVALVFEDLHWADEGSVCLLSYAASTLADQPVGFMLTWRETDLAAAPASAGLRELSRLPALIRIELEGLDDEAIADLAHAVGRPLTVEETASVHRRCDGNPLFVREVLAHADMTIGSGRRWSTVIDAVNDRIERLPEPAAAALRVASLFRRSFSVASVAPLCEQDPDLVQEAFNRAVHSGILHEVDPTAGTYRFRHSLTAEVLASRQLAVDLAATHQKIGHQLLQTFGPPIQAATAMNGPAIEAPDGAGYELAYHLSKSPGPDDRLLAGQVGLGLVGRRLDMGRLAEVDAYVDIAFAAASQPRALAEPWSGELFTIDALLYESWRAWLDGNPEAWQENAARALALAVEAAPPTAQGRSSPRPKGQSPQPIAPEEAERRHERLQMSVMNMISRPILPVGPTEIGNVGFDQQVGGELLSEATDRLGTEDPAKWASQLHRVHIDGLGRPGRSGQQKAAREGLKMVAAARKRLRSDEMPPVLRTCVTRFAESIDPENRLSLLAEISRLQPDHGPTLFEARFAYPALMELGRLPEAVEMIESALERALDDGQAFPIASGRLLLIRHLAWVGDLNRAEDQMNVALADWNRLSLPEPLSLARQRLALQVLLHPRVANVDESAPAPTIGRVSRAEYALRLSRRGAVVEAIQCLDQVLETIGVRHLTLSEQAHLAVVAAEVGHDKAAVTAADMLRQYGDQPVMRADGSLVLGPASLFAGVAAKAAGDRRAAESRLEAATRAIQRFGGSPMPVDLLICDLGYRSGSNRLPTNS